MTAFSKTLEFQNPDKAFTKKLRTWIRKCEAELEGTRIDFCNIEFIHSWVYMGMGFNNYVIIYLSRDR